MIIEKKITDQILILGLDYSCRESMKKYETGVLLSAAKKLATFLSLPINPVPIEGYYNETKELKLYFTIMRALQKVEKSILDEIINNDDYKKILQVFTSPIFGKYNFGEYIIPNVDDPINTVMKKLPPLEWSAEKIINEAYDIVSNADDYSLTGIGILTKDPITITALRESAVLYVSGVQAIGNFEEPEYRYIWNVSDKVQKVCNIFINEFNKLTESSILPAVDSNAEYFNQNYIDNKIRGRCVRTGTDESGNTDRFYHWAIDVSDGYDLVFKEFWDEKLWTTEMFREGNPVFEFF
ncbi:MAG: hypothetical protein JW982_08950 [Spirochaetes bacterium]|nr:hypothetical protein [Spirochaetota bacterium]